MEITRLVTLEKRTRKRSLGIDLYVECVTVLRYALRIKRHKGGEKYVKKAGTIGKLKFP